MRLPHDRARCRTCGSLIDPEAGTGLIDEELCRECKQDNLKAQEVYHRCK